MKKCPNCEKEIEDDAKTCEFCGFSFEKNEAATQEQKSKKARGTLQNILFYFGFARMIVISAVFMIFCAFAVWFFAGQRQRFLEVQDLRQSCTLMIVIFSIFLAFGLACLILSIVQNIKKKKKKTD